MSPSVKTLRDWIIVIVIAISSALLVRVFLLQQYFISGPSMQTTLFQDNRVLVNKMSYVFGHPERGDVVVFDRQTINGNAVEHDDLIKRVIALPGEKIRIEDCVVYINDVALKESYLDKDDLAISDASLRCGRPQMDVLVVPPHQYFVMGDNRAQSHDSRAFGPISEDDIVGRAFAVVWPFSAMKFL